MEMYLNETENAVIGYLRGYVIVQDEMDNLYYVEGGKEYYEIGSYVFKEELKPIGELSEILREEIRRDADELQGERVMDFTQLKNTINGMEDGDIFNITWGK